MALRIGLLVALRFLLGAQLAFAAVSEEEAKRLDTDLTPTGAERAGNAAGTIPAWDGGLTAPPPGIAFTPPGFHPDPYAGEKPLFTVSAANMAHYDAQLTETHKALLGAYPGSYFLNVYPTHRSCANPDYVYAAIKRNALTGQLATDGNNITGATISVPFPIPQSVREILWNQELRYQGFKLTRESAAAAPTRSGKYALEVALDQWIYRYSDPELTRVEDLDNMYIHFIKRGIAPPSNAGTMAVVYNPIDNVAEKRKGWFYKPGERKVKQVIGADYDGFDPGGAGIRTNDNFNIFNGGVNRFDWEQLGKQEKFVVYNDFRFASPDVRYRDILHKNHLNPEHIRYELHRTWVIEGKLKPGQSHSVAARRRMYIDEDTWAPTAAALYDKNDKLARVQEAHIFNYYDQPLCNIASDVVYDIAGGRYHVVGLRNEQKPVNWDIEDSPETFSAEGIRRSGVR